MLSCCEALIFDLDGTILDSSELHAEAFRETLGEIGITGFVYAKYAGWRTDDVFRSVLEGRHRDFDASLIQDLVARKRRRAHRMLKQPLPFIPGADRFIEIAVGAKKRLAIATSASRANAMQGLSARGLDRLFEVIVTGDDVACAKPEPDIYLEAIRQLGCAHRRCVAFEDAESGYRSARMADLTTVVIGWQGCARPDWVASNARYKTFYELAALLEAN